MATIQGSPKEYVLDLGNEVTMKFRLIPAGEFSMGRRVEDIKNMSYDWRPEHKVTITNPFYMAIYETTQEQYHKVTGKNLRPVQAAQIPVNEASWNDATEFCNMLSEQTGRTIRLPTEAEWEYACRAGSTTLFCFGDDKSKLGEYAWYSKNRKDYQPWPVGQKKPNAFGLYDMHGNVAEWCADYYAQYSPTPERDPTGPSSGQTRVIRGGCFNDYAGDCCSVARDVDAANQRGEGQRGFRVVLE